MNEESLYQKSFEYFVNYRFDKALRLISEATTRFPNSGRLFDLEGIILEKLERIRAAISSLEKATILSPLTPLGQIVLSSCYLKIGKPALAKTILEFMADSDTTPVDMLKFVAEQLGSIKEYHLALQVCRRSAMENPNSAESFYGVAYYMERLCYPNRLIANVLKHILSIEPGRFLVRLSLMNLHFEAGDVQSAFDIVADEITELNLRKICCVGCMKKLIQVLNHAGALHLASMCVDRLRAMKSTT